MKIGLSCLFILIALEVYLAPFTKVEESFNLQATHDLINQVDQFDHLLFPGVVPRTFFGALILSCLTWPLSLFSSAIQQQILVRIILGGLVVLSLGQWSFAVKKLFGSTTANITIVLFLCQFHLVFWSSRTLPNTLALPWVGLGLSHWLLGLSQTNGRTYHFAWLIRYLTFAGIVFRFEVGILLVLILSFEYLVYPGLSILSILKNIIFTAVLSLLITVPIDSYFWNTLVWPEGKVFYFNAILNKSSEWGTLPFYSYFLLFLPRLLLVSYPLAWIGFYLDQRVRRMLIPLIIYVLVFSILPHKEWRFIMYVIPPFTTAAAVTISSIVISSRRSILYRFVLLGVMALSVVSFVISILFFQISRLNYPGGEALKALHTIESNNKQVKVHLDAESAMTGASLYGQTNPYWIYSKNESETTLDDFIKGRYTHLITAKPQRFTSAFEVIHVIEGFDKVEIKSLEEYKLSITNNDVSPIKLVMTPKIYILRLKNPHKELIQHTINSNPIVLYSKTYCPFCKGVKQILSKYCKDIKVIEVDLDKNQFEIKKALHELTGRATFPNLFKNGKSLGGYDNLSVLDREGKLNDLC